MKKELVKEVLNRNPKMFKALHDLYDFDFMEEYQIIKINGRFTLNSLKKSLGITDLTGLNTAVIITNVRYREKYNYIVKAIENGFCISHEKPFYGFYYNVSNFYGKGCFEDARKEENIIVYVICQKKELAKKASEKKPDLNERFTFKYVTRWGDGKGRHGIAQIDLIDKQHNNKKFTYNTRRPESSENVNYYIDKSGYLVEEQKNELKRKAAKLRTEREKAAADAVNFDNEINVINNKLLEIKTKLAVQLMEVNNYENACNIDKITGVLRWLYLSVDRFTERNEKKQFSSIPDANSRLNNINLEIEKIVAMF